MDELTATKELARKIVHGQGNLFVRELVRDLKDDAYRSRRTEKELIEVIERAINDGAITYASLVEWLTRVEGWGRGSVYLWTIRKKLAKEPFWTESELKKLVRQADMGRVWDDTVAAKSPATGPDVESASDFSETFKLRRVRFRDRALTFEWHKAWPRLIRDETLDFIDDERDADDLIEYHAYRRSDRRAVVRMQLRPLDGLAAAFVQAPVGSTEHGAVLDEAKEAVARTVGESLDQYKMADLIVSLDQRQLRGSDDALWSKNSRLVGDGGYLEVGSTAKGLGYRDLPSLRDARAALVGADFVGDRAEIYFQAPGGMDTERPVSAVFHGREGRFRLRAAMTEDQVWAFIRVVTG